ncbi:hypothetical protein DENSPDRAFT_886430 [Dentipellis sp. KUC8613]|nr:hypothetical protein DENSPDRAFT_886430 [Dentipellis sp. KUC8613]
MPPSGAVTPLSGIVAPLLRNPCGAISRPPDNVSALECPTDAAPRQFEHVRSPHCMQHAHAALSSRCAARSLRCAVMLSPLRCCPVTPCRCLVTPVPPSRAEAALWCPVALIHALWHCFVLAPPFGAPSAISRTNESWLVHVLLPELAPRTTRCCHMHASRLAHSPPFRARTATSCARPVIIYARALPSRPCAATLSAAAAILYSCIAVSRTRSCFTLAHRRCVHMPPLFRARHIVARPHAAVTHLAALSSCPTVFVPGGAVSRPAPPSSRRAAHSQCCDMPRRFCAASAVAPHPAVFAPRPAVSRSAWPSLAVAHLAPQRRHLVACGPAPHLHPLALSPRASVRPARPLTAVASPLAAVVQLSCAPASPPRMPMPPTHAPAVLFRGWWPCAALARPRAADTHTCTVVSRPNSALERSCERSRVAAGPRSPSHRPCPATNLPCSTAPPLRTAALPRCGAPPRRRHAPQHHRLMHPHGCIVPGGAASRLVTRVTLARYSPPCPRIPHPLACRREPSPSLSPVVSLAITRCLPRCHPPCPPSCALVLALTGPPSPKPSQAASRAIPSHFVRPRRPLARLSYPRMLLPASPVPLSLPRPLHASSGHVMHRSAAGAISPSRPHASSRHRHMPLHCHCPPRAFALPSPAPCCHHVPSVAVAPPHSPPLCPLASPPPAVALLPCVTCPSHALALRRRSTPRSALSTPWRPTPLRRAAPRPADPHCVACRP